MLVITFPLRGAKQAEGLIHGYTSTRKTHGSAEVLLKVILLGSTGIWTSEDPGSGGWTLSDSPYDTSNPRAQAEDALLRLQTCSGCVLNLSGLYGGARQPWNWIERVAKSKEDIKAKGSLHLIHGDDVGKAIVGAHQRWQAVQGKRWIVTDLRVYDWWEIILRYDRYMRLKWREERRQRKVSEGGMSNSTSTEIEDKLPTYGEWVKQLMDEEGIRALPREGQRLGRRLDGRDIWRVTGQRPLRWMGDEWGAKEEEMTERANRNALERGG